MSNLSDKEIDRLSRDAADSFEPDASSLSWTRLEQKLVEQMPERPPDGFQFGRISPYIWGPAVVLLAGISSYFIKSNFYNKFSTRTIVPLSQVNKILPDSAKSATAHSYTDRISDERSSSSAADKEVATGSRSSQASPLKSVSGSRSSINDRGSKTGVSSGVPASTGTRLPGSNSSGAPGSSASHATAENGLSINQSSSEISSPGSLITSGTASVSAGSGNSTLEASKYTLPPVITASARLGTVKGNDSLLNSLAERKSAEPHKSMRINRSLSIGFTFGADYTDGGGISNDQLSNNIGITLGYYLTNKLSVNTGFIYSNKFYWAPGTQNRGGMPAYSSNTFAWAPDIEYVNGAFNMYELPLTLRYDFAKNEKTRFFVNAGASSYFLVKQTNIYYTHNGGGRLSAWLSKDDSPANYWFGVGDLSFGLETDIGKGFSFQAEPFFRIPFQKMGVEDLKIFSYGIMLSFRYAPVLSRSKK